MDVQTQLMDQDNSQLQAEISAQATVADFKNQLSLIRAQRVTIAQQLNSIGIEIKKTTDARENLIAMFRSEAVAMYPEIEGQDVFEVLQSVSTDIPLYDLWNQYSQKVDDLSATLKGLYDQLNEGGRAFDEYSAQEQAALDNYKSFSESSPVPVPSVEEFIKTLQAIEVIPFVEEGSVRASLPAIEMLSHEAAAMVTLQTLENEKQSIGVSEQEKVMTQDNSQIQTLQPAHQESAVAVQPVEANSFLKKYGIFIGIGALMYLAFGGNRRGE